MIPNIKEKIKINFFLFFMQKYSWNFEHWMTSIIFAKQAETELFRLKETEY